MPEQDAAVFQNATDEKNVLAAALAHTANRERFVALLRPEDFTLDEGKVIAWGLLRAHGEGRTPDPRSFHTLVEDCTFGHEFGGYKLLQAMIASCPRPLADIDALCERVRLIGTKDRAFSMLTHAADVAQDPTRPITDIRASIEEIGKALDGAAIRDTRGLRTPAEINPDYYAVLAERQEGGGFRPTGLDPLDDAMAQGFLAGRMTVMAARPSIGKTSLVSNLVFRTASLRVGSAAVFVNEATEIDVWDKLNSVSTGIPLLRLGKEAHKLTSSEKQMLLSSMRARESLPMEIDDSRVFSLAQMEETIALRYRAGSKFDVVFVDMFSRADEFRDERVRGGHTPTILHDSLVRIQQIAKRYEFHAVLTVQIGRYDGEGKAQGRGGQGRMTRPGLNDIYGADAYYQAADNIILLHNCNFYDQIRHADSILEVWIRKQRYGEPTMRCLDFDKETARIRATTSMPVDFTDAERARYAYTPKAKAFAGRR